MAATVWHWACYDRQQILSQFNPLHITEITVIADEHVPVQSTVNYKINGHYNWPWASSIHCTLQNPWSLKPILSQFSPLYITKSMVTETDPEPVQSIAYQKFQGHWNRSRASSVRYTLQEPHCLSSILILSTSLGLSVQSDPFINFSAEKFD
jgi:hypothetical protein